MNQLHSKDLRNHYYLVRHGKSKTADKIVSHPENGVKPESGLCRSGLIESRLSALAFKKCEVKPVIYSSDFARARQTAIILHNILKGKLVGPSPALRERDFGALEGKPVDRYQEVWEADAQDPYHTIQGVESVIDVWDRVAGFVHSVDGIHTGETIMLVSHGDTLQILQAGVSGIDPAYHRSLPPLKTAEVRPLNPA